MSSREGGTLNQSREYLGTRRKFAKAPRPRPSFHRYFLNAKLYFPSLFDIFAAQVKKQLGLVVARNQKSSEGALRFDVKVRDGRLKGDRKGNGAREDPSRHRIYTLKFEPPGARVGNGIRGSAGGKKARSPRHYAARAR